MSDDLERQLAAFGQTLDAQTPEPIQSPAAAGGDIEPTPLHAGRDRRWWAIIGAAAIVMAAIAGFVVVNSTSDDDSDIAPVDTGSSLPAPVDTTIPTDTTSPATTEPDDTSTSSSSTTVPTTAALAGVAGPWTRECVDQEGTPGSAPADDELADEPFGPLAPEPGVRLVYPETPPMDDGSMMPAESRTIRVPGGILIRLTTTGDELNQVVAVVDDDGAIRWRRCLPGSSGWSWVIDDVAGVAHVQMYPATTNEVEWWTFDLATGASAVTDGAPAGSDEPIFEQTDVNFDYSGSAQILQRTTTDGTVLWQRDDLFSTADEGFTVDWQWMADSGLPIMVRACAGGPPNWDQPTPDGEPCEYRLLGIDGDDGSTVWEHDGAFGVPLIADGYAIVTAPVANTARYVLLDLESGEFVPDGVSSDVGAFPFGCCATDLHDRVEASGAMAWSASVQWLDVWFPADRPGPGVTVDLLGPADEASVVLHHWSVTTDQCPMGSSCLSTRVVGHGFPAGETVTVTCWQSDGGEWRATGETAELTVGADGTATANGPCSFPLNLDGTIGSTPVRAMIDDVESNVIG